MDPATIGAARPVPGTPAALRFTGVRALAALPRRDGSAWIVDLRPRAEAPTDDIAVTPDLSSMPARLLLKVAAPSDPLAVTDPEVGDKLLVVPIPEPAKGVADGVGDGPAGGQAVRQGADLL